MQMWSAYEPSLRSALLELFERFELLCRAPAPSNRIIAPALLPLLPPDPAAVDAFMESAGSAEVSAFGSRVVTLDFVPLGLFGRLTVRLLRAGWQVHHLWRAGMALERGTSRMLIELQPETRTVGFVVRAAQLQRASYELVMLCEALDTLLQEWVSLPCTAGMKLKHSTTHPHLTNAHFSYPHSSGENRKGEGLVFAHYVRAHVLMSL